MSGPASSGPAPPGPTSPGTVTLSFDNGPEPDVTPAVLEVLRARGLRATFFVLGRKLAAHRALAERAHAEGHWIGNHTWSHAAPLGHAAPGVAEAEIDRAQALIGDLAHPDRLFRPQGGGGALGPHLLNRAALRHLEQGGYTCVTWTAVPGDFRDPDGWVERALRMCAGGAALVLHDLPNGAMRHLDRFLGLLADRGTGFAQEFPEECVLLRRGRPTRGLAGYVSAPDGAGAAAYRRPLLGALAASPLALAMARAARAQPAARGAWPDRPVRLVVPFAAGTTTDILGRILAEALGRDLGQPVVVDNRSGAGGNVGAQAVAQAPGDGYTLLLGTNGTHGINASLFPDLGFDPVRDFTPIAPFVATPAVLAVRPALGVATVAALLALGRQRPLTLASAGNGTTGHLSQALLNLRTGLATEHVPYRNAGQGVTDLLAGRVDAMFYHPLGLKAHLEAGALLPLAVTAARRVPTLPAVPTMAESGIDDFVVEGLWNLFGPARLPEEIVGRLNRVTNALLADPAALRNLRAQGVEPTGGTPEALAQQTREQISKWRPIIAAAGIRPD